eukprot:RCo002465
MRLFRWVSSRLGTQEYHALSPHDQDPTHLPAVTASTATHSPPAPSGLPSASHWDGISRLPARLRGRILGCLKEGEGITYSERHFQWGLFASYLLLGFLPLVFWTYLLVTDELLKDNLSSGQAPLASEVGIVLSVICAAMSVGTIPVCRNCVVFTTERLLKLNEGGPMAYIRSSKLEPLAASQIVSRKAPYKVRANLSGGASPGPLLQLTFHYVENVWHVENLVWDEDTARGSKGRPPPEGSSAAPDLLGRLPPVIAERVRPTLQPGEHVLWAEKPAVWRIALFSCSLTVLTLTNLQWLLWAWGMRHMTSMFVGISVVGLVMSLLVGWMEWMQCNVAYIITDRAFSVFYMSRLMLLSFPFGQLASVGIWIERSCSGSVSFTFRCNEHSERCLSAEREMGRFLTYHIRRLPEDHWCVPLKSPPQFVQRVLSTGGTELHEVPL